MTDETGPWVYKLEHTIEAFSTQFNELRGFHRVMVKAARESFDDAVEEAEGRLNPEDHDMGDVYWSAEQSLGTNSHDMSQHLGLMVVVRAVSLAELTFARIASKFFTDSQSVVFIGGRAWDHDWARLFFKSALARQVDIDGDGMDVVRELRNLYAHAYGDFPTWESARTLEMQIKEVVGGPLVSEKEEFEFGSEHYVFGPYGSSRSFADRDSEYEWDLPTAHLSPLYASRLLDLIGKKVMEVADAAQWGLLSTPDLLKSKFAKDWVKRHGDPESGDVALNYEAEVVLVQYGKKFEILGLGGGKEQITTRMRDGRYRGSIELSSWSELI